MPAWLKSVRWRTVLVRALLMPVLPCIQWGPFTHPDIARRAYQKCSGAAADAPIPEIREAIVHWRARGDMRSATPAQRSRRLSAKLAMVSSPGG